MKKAVSLFIALAMLLMTIFCFSGCGDGRVGKSVDIGGHTYWYYD